MSAGIDTLVWANVQAGVWAAALLLVGLLGDALLRGRLPAWRKGLWIGVMFVPLAAVLVGLLTPIGRSPLLPSDWLAKPARPADATRPRSSLAPAAPVPVAAPVAPRVARWAMGGWVAFVALLELGAALRMRALLRGARDLGDTPVAALYARLVKAVGCAAAPPRVVSSAQVAAPFIVASPWRGLTIVLPHAMARAAAASPADEEALRAVLAHELAHARAGDPWVQRAMSLLRLFFPLPWLAALAAAGDFWEEAAEETGDLRAVRASGLAESTYARVLKDAAFGPKAVPAALGFSTVAAGASPAGWRIAARVVRRLRNLPLARHWSETWVTSLGAAGRAVAVGTVLVFLARGTLLSDLMHDPRRLPPAPLPAPSTQPAPAPAPALIAPPASVVTAPPAAAPPDRKNVKVAAAAAAPAAPAPVEPRRAKPERVNPNPENQRLIEHERDEKRRLREEQGRIKRFGIAAR